MFSFRRRPSRCPNAQLKVDLRFRILLEQYRIKRSIDHSKLPKLLALWYQTSKIRPIRLLLHFPQLLEYTYFLSHRIKIRAYLQDQIVIEIFMFAIDNLEHHALASKMQDLPDNILLIAKVISSQAFITNLETVELWNLIFLLFWFGFYGLFLMLFQN